MPQQDDRAFSELSKAEKLKKARSASAKAKARYTGPMRADSREERAGAFKAWKAADRVVARLTEGGAGKGKNAPSSDTGDKPAARRRVVEKATGTSGIIDPLREVERKTRKSSK